MPKDYFFNLKPKKVENVFEGATYEFSGHLKRKASINRIIEKVGISRGSFYNYFVDVDDLYGYVVDRIYNEFFDALVTTIHESYGNVGLAFNRHMEKMPTMYKGRDKQLLKNMFLNLKMDDVMKNDNSIAATVGEESMDKFYRSIDRSRYNLTDQEFYDFTDMLFMILANFVVSFVKESKPIGELLENYTRKVDLIHNAVKV